MTSYDVIFTQFMEINKVDPISLPQTDEQKYEMIKNAVKHYNNRLRANIQCNDYIEELDKGLNEDELILIAHYLKLSFLENELTYFNNLYQPFMKEIGISNFQSQLRGKQDLVDRELKRIEEIIFNSTEDYL